MTPPTGTFLAQVRDGLIRFPSPIHAFCESAGWNLFRVEMIDDHRLDILPVLDDDLSLSETDLDDTDIDESGESGVPDDFYSSLSDEGRLWIPAVLRGMVGLGEQSVMMRIENGGIGIYLRKVFETLGFGP
jgi:hypothetical protein